jgi:hypothetical protein
VIDGLSVLLRASNAAKFSIDGTGVSFYGAATVAQQASPGQVTGTADATYSATEQQMLNDLVAAVNAHTDALEAYGLEV